MATVQLKTNLGNITLSLNEDLAPKSVANFLAYAKSGHYNGTIFHRVIKNFMIQCVSVKTWLISSEAEGGQMISTAAIRAKY